MPMLVVDAEGNVVFFNEPAEGVLGASYAEAGAMHATEWESLFQIEDLEGNPIPLEQMPGGIALVEQRPAHRVVRLTGRDDVKRTVAATGFPLFARADEFVGAVAIFWQDPDDADSAES